MCAVELGLPHTPQEFNLRAIAIRHPFDSLQGVPDETLVAVFKLLTLGPSGLERLREAKILHYMKLAAKLGVEEKRLKESLPEHCRSTLAKKRLLLY